MTPAKSVNYS